MQFYDRNYIVFCKWGNYLYYPFGASPSLDIRPPRRKIVDDLCMCGCHRAGDWPRFGVSGTAEGSERAGTQQRLHVVVGHPHDTVRLRRPRRTASGNDGNNGQRDGVILWGVHHQTNCLRTIYRRQSNVPW